VNPGQTRDGPPNPRPRGPAGCLSAPGSAGSALLAANDLGHRLSFGGATSGVGAAALVVAQGTTTAMCRARFRSGRRRGGAGAGGSCRRSEAAGGRKTDTARVEPRPAPGSCCGRGCLGRSGRCRRRTVSPSRKFRRFESFTCHHQRKQPLTCSDVGQGLSRVRPAVTGGNRSSTAVRRQYSGKFWPTSRFRCPVRELGRSLTSRHPRGRRGPARRHATAH
jgi:hypothetical protein